MTDLPDPVRTSLKGEPVTDRVPLGGGNELVITPTRTLRYHAEGLLGDESVDELPHDAERLSVADGRRKTTIALDYGLAGERTSSVPSGRVDDVLKALLPRILSATGVLDPEEEAVGTFRFNELTVVVSERRLVEHVGAAVWDGEHEEVPFDAVAGIGIEEGRVATQVVLDAAGRRKRIKVPNERARAFEECLRTAIRAYHGVDSIDGLDGGTEEGDDTPAVEGVDTLALDRSLGSSKGMGGGRKRADGDRNGTPSEPPIVGGAVSGSDGEPDPGPGADEAACLDALAEAVEEQEALLARQRREIERLREELGLTRGRGR
jgi:hypothetical protein